MLNVMIVMMVLLLQSNYSQVNAQPSGFDGSLCLLYQLASLAKGAFDHMFTIILIFILNIINHHTSLSTCQFYSL